MKNSDEQHAAWTEAGNRLDELVSLHETLPVLTDRQRLIRGCAAMVIGELLIRRDRPAGGWQPIETAPKDGSQIVIYWPYWSSDPFIANYSGDSGGWEGERCLTPTHAEAYPERQPTHWMPLPKPPAVDSGVAT